MAAVYNPELFNKNLAQFRILYYLVVDSLFLKIYRDFWLMIYGRLYYTS